MFNKKRAFTLIELLIVIAVIGIIASVILVNLNDNKNDAKDSIIMMEANQIMKAAQVNYNKTGSYANWYVGGAGGWITSEGDCATAFTSLTNSTQQTSARVACSNIAKNIGLGSHPSNWMLWIWSWNQNDSGSNSCSGLTSLGSNGCLKFSILAWLPGQQRYFCIGSNGKTSTQTTASGGGCGKTDTQCQGGGYVGCFNCPGCPGDVSASGS